MVTRYENGVLVGEPEPKPTDDIKGWLEKRLAAHQRLFAEVERSDPEVQKLADRSYHVAAISVCNEALYHLKRLED